MDDYENPKVQKLRTPFERVCGKPNSSYGHFCTLARDHEKDHETWKNGAKLDSWPNKEKP